MTNAVSRLFVAGLVTLMPVSAQSTAKIRVCVNPSNDARTLMLLRAEALTSRMFATVGVAIEWHFAGNAACQGLRKAQTFRLDFDIDAPATYRPGALGYARPYEGSRVVVLFDRIENSAGSSRQISNLLAHVMTHEITHLLEGMTRHSLTGVMKAHWEPKDFDLMSYHPLPFAPDDVELIQLGLARRFDAGTSLAGTAIDDLRASGDGSGRP